MKKILLLFLMIFMSAPCFAFQNYMVLTDKQISKIKVSNEEIITVQPIKALNNEGKAMIILPHQTGYTRLSFCKGKKHINLLVKVSENETCIKHVNGIKLIPIDLPPELK